MPRAGSSSRDKGPDSVLPKSHIVNKEGAEKVRKLMVPDSQRQASVVSPVSFLPTTERPERILIHLSPNSVVILAIFAHFCEMFVEVPLVDEEAGGAQWTGGGDAVSGRPQTVGRDAVGGRLQAGGRDATGGRRQAGRRDATSSSHQVGSKDAAGSGVEAPGDEGKRLQSYVALPSSSSSPSPPRQRPVAGGAKEGGRGGQSLSVESGTEARSRAREPEDQGQADRAMTGALADPSPEAGSTAAPQRPGSQSPPPKRRKVDPEPKPQGPDFRIPESQWQYRGPKSTPPKDPAGGQRQPEEPRPALVPGPSMPAPEPSAPADPEPRAPPCPESRAAAAPERPTPSEPAPSTPRSERAVAVEVVAVRAAPVWQSSGTPSASVERDRRGPSTRLLSS
ncbi:vegetative cell wall protein gp1-like [Phragmites australis]|uniref:vegetative cell wall protein gp1-like n=1 Tax=Phragmites australis TaxID=29695 RepID=UPI002D769E97|nr:vegetative cell wall protein gp1-like [Phragmites australis]